MADRLASAWSRVRRADRHLREVRGRVNRFLNSNPYTIREKDDSGPDEVTIRVIPTRKPSALWDSMVADCLHNYRSALDHAVWALTERHGQPTRNRTFPIYLKRTEFRKKYRGDVGDTGRCGAKAVIERFQPYKRGNGGDHSPLWLLHELDRFAKHRRLGELVLHFLDYDLDVIGPPGATEVRFDDHIGGGITAAGEPVGDPLNGDALQVHIRLFSHAASEVEMYFAAIPSIMLRQPHLAHRGALPLLPVLNLIEVAVRDVLVQLDPICNQP